MVGAVPHPYYVCHRHLPLPRLPIHAEASIAGPLSGEGGGEGDWWGVVGAVPHPYYVCHRHLPLPRLPIHAEASIVDIQLTDSLFLTEDI